MFDEDWGIEVDEDVQEQQVQEALMGIISGEWDVDDTVLKGARVESYTQAGLLTRDNGVVITVRGGREFQVRIIQSR